jgi:hypothetical protein
MIGGIGLVGLITATLASWIVQRVADEGVAKQAAIAAHIDTLRANLERDISSLRTEIHSIAETLADQRSKPGPVEGFVWCSFGNRKSSGRSDSP